MRLTIAAISASIAAAAVAAGFDRLLVQQPAWVWWGATAAVFAVAFGIAWVASGYASSRAMTSIASRNRSGRNMRAKLRDIDVSSAAPSEVASRNRSGGDMDITVDRLKIKK